jgi:xanthine/CO dehydrogenase XdhC/CoxF family maturation factor
MNSAAEFQRLLAGVRTVEAGNFAQRVALATIVRTHGSTFRRAGASMLVHEDGRVVCALSGGCPEQDIIKRARAAIASDRPEIARYNDESAGDLLFEAGCGGELDVLIEPLARPSDIQFFDVLAQLHAQRRSGFIATAYAQRGKALTPRPRRLIWHDAVAWSDFDDAQLSDAIMAIGAAMPASTRALVQSLDGAAGRFDILFEGVRPVHALIIVGANPIAAALANCAGQLSWKTVVVDQRELATKLPAETLFIRSSPATVLQNIPLDVHSSAVVMTFNVERDIEWLSALAQAPLAYLGAIGSRERAARMHATVTNRHTPLHAPAGLDVGSETPEEIALAVSAEILAVLNAREGLSLGKSAMTIHP